LDRNVIGGLCFPFHRGEFAADMTSAHEIIEGDLAYMTERLGDTFAPLGGNRLLITRWSEFDELPSKLSALDNPPLLFDGQRMLDKASVPRYEGIGL
jgi:hypothetical protein